MIVVVDTNIIFSALLSKNASFVEILLDKSYQFIAPHFLFTEIFKHKEKIQQFSKLNADELLELLNLLFSNIQFISVTTVAKQSVEKAIELCNETDLKDVPFITLCIEFNALLWSGDNALKQGLQNKNFNQFFK